MSITIKKQPQELTPVYNQMIIVATSSNQTQENFQFVADIYCDANYVTRMKVPVNPEGYGVFDIHKHLENRVSFDFNPNQYYINRATQSFATYSVNFSEEWRQYWPFTDNFYVTGTYLGAVGFYGPTQPYFNVGDEILIQQNPGFSFSQYDGVHTILAISFSTPNWYITTDGNWQGSSPTNSGTMSLANFGLNSISTTASISKQYTFNGVTSFGDYINWDYTDWDATTTSPYGKWFTNTPDNYELTLDSLMWLNLYQNVSSEVSKVFIKTDNGTYSMTNTFTSMTSDNNRFLQVSIGPKQLLSATSSLTVVSGTLPVLSSTTKYMTIWTENSTSGITIAPKTYKIIDGCSRYEKIQLIFMDKMGSFIPFTFNMVNRNNKTINRTDYQQHYGSYAPATNNWNYNTYDRGRKTLDIVVIETYTINSNWVNQETSNYLMELFESPEVYWKKEDGTIVAINVTSTDTERKQTINDQVINYTLTFELSNKNMTQRG